jgi:DMSO/TMAO reductase YedYZ molybdopterin-dependent catalytic subunit
MSDADRFLADHRDITRRFFIGCGVAGGAAALAPGWAAGDRPPELAKALESLGPYFSPQGGFQDVSRGDPLPHRLPEAKKREVGLTRETWRLEVVSDPERPATLGATLAARDGTALDFAGLLRLGERHAVRFAKIMTCLNLGCPLGTGVWEGVPLREVVWLTKPRGNLRRVFYHGYHNDDPKQLFRSSLPVGRVFEDPDDLPPVILCYKLNGDWLTPERGGPVRVVVPEHYGFKSVKWLTRVVLSNLPHANDTYADGNNDIDSPLKTFAATLHVPSGVRAGDALPVTGYAQVGVSGLSKVQVWVHPAGPPWPADDPYFTSAPWADAEVLPPPAEWGAAAPAGAWGFDPAGRPKAWPMRLTKAHWAALLPGRPAGAYTLRCRAVDAKGHAQPMPRPFRKSGRCDIEAVGLTVR